MYLLRTISALHFPAPRTADIRDWGELIRLRALNADVYREHSALWAPASVFQSDLVRYRATFPPGDPPIGELFAGALAAHIL